MNNIIYPIDECLICMNEKIDISICNNCKYVICSDCIRKWQKTSNSCPHCRLENTYKIEYNNKRRKIKECNKLENKIFCCICTSLIIILSIFVYVYISKYFFIG